MSPIFSQWHCRVLKLLAQATGLTSSPSKFHRTRTIEVHIGEVISRQKGLLGLRIDWGHCQTRPDSHAKTSFWRGHKPDVTNSCFATPFRQFEEELSFTVDLVHPSSQLYSAFSCQYGCRTVCESAHISNHIQTRQSTAANAEFRRLTHSLRASLAANHNQKKRTNPT